MNLFFEFEFKFKIQIRMSYNCGKPSHELPNSNSKINQVFSEHYQFEKKTKMHKRHYLVHDMPNSNSNITQDLRTYSNFENKQKNCENLFPVKKCQKPECITFLKIIIPINKRSALYK